MEWVAVVKPQITAAVKSGRAADHRTLGQTGAAEAAFFTGRAQTISGTRADQGSGSRK